MKRTAGIITSCAILIGFILLPGLAVTEIFKGEDGVWRNSPFPRTTIPDAKQRNPGAIAAVFDDGLRLPIDRVTEQCVAHYRNDIRKTAECVLRGTDVAIDRIILKNCTRPWDHDLGKALSCYSSKVGGSTVEQPVITIKFRDKSLDMIQKGLRTCLSGLQNDSPGYHRCFTLWDRKKDDMWQVPQVKSI